jgi:hypothetical protein
MGLSTSPIGLFAINEISVPQPGESCAADQSLACLGSCP